MQVYTYRDGKWQEIAGSDETYTKNSLKIETLRMPTFLPLSPIHLALQFYMKAYWSVNHKKQFHDCLFKINL